jgi:5-(carboxyamino)imidazole ribonucleotide synthase
VLREPRAKLHLYGKKEARPGRKMGHFTVLGDDVGRTLETARTIQSQLFAAARGTA